MMRREKVEHILRAAGAVTGKKEFVLIGSAAVVAWGANLPEVMAISRDVDLFAYDEPDQEAISAQLDGSLGQASPFDAEFGYYCDGVGAETAILPLDWQARAMRFANANTGGVTAIVPEPNDIAISKLCAWRPKDIAWLHAAASHRIIDLPTMRKRLANLPARAGGLAALEPRLGQIAAGLT